jgi:hypothetical protein
MSSDQRAAFNAIVVDGLSIEEAAARLALPEDETLRHFVHGFRIHAAAIGAPGWRDATIGVQSRCRLAHFDGSHLPRPLRKNPPQKWGGGGPKRLRHR